MAKAINTKRSYFGLGYDSEIMQFTWKEVVEYVGSKLAVALFKGNFQDELSFLLQQVAAWAIFQEVNKVDS